MSVMRENWYKPAPGNPYNPSIAWPSKFRSLNHSWKRCKGIYWYTGYDPPRTLTPVSRIAPDTTADPTRISTLDPNAAKAPQQARISHSRGPAVMPAAKPKPEQPARTASPSPAHSSAIVDPATKTHVSLRDLAIEESIRPRPATTKRVPSLRPNGAATRQASSENEKSNKAEEKSDTSKESPSPSISRPDSGFPDPRVSPALQAEPPKPGPGSVVKTSRKQRPHITLGTDKPTVRQSAQNENTAQHTENMGQQRKPTHGSPSKTAGLASGLRQASETSKSSVIAADQGLPLKISSDKVLESKKGDPLITANGPFLTSSEPAATATDPQRVPPMFLRPKQDETSVMKAKAQGSAPGSHDPSDEGRATQSRRTPGETASTQTFAAMIAGSTLEPNGLGITLSGKENSLASSALVVGSKRLLMESLATQPAISIFAGEGGDRFSHAVAIDGTTHMPGEPAFTISGIAVSLASTALIIGTKVVPLTPSTANDILATVKGSPVIAQLHVVALAGSTLKPGDPAFTISGIKVSLEPTALLIGPKAIPLSATSEGNKVFASIGSSPVTALPQAVEVVGATLKSNGAAFTISGIEVSLESNALLIGSSTLVILTVNLGIAGDPTIIMSGRLLTASLGEVLVDSATVKSEHAESTGRVRIPASNHGEMIVGPTQAKSISISDGLKSGSLAHISQSPLPGSYSSSSSATASGSCGLPRGRVEIGTFGVLIIVLATILVV